MKKTLTYFLYYIEITSHCNLQCPTCPNGQSTGNDLPQGMMSLERFKEILDKIELESPGEATYINLYSWGEPFMHPQLPQFIEMSRKRGIPPQLSTNLNISKNIEEVVQAEPQSIRISLSSFDQESYFQTHYPGNINNVIDNAQFLRTCLDKYHSNVPVHFYYHKYKHNQGETMEKAKAFAESLGFEFQSIYATYGPLEKALSIFEGKRTKEDEAIMSMFDVSLEEFRERALTLREDYPDCELRTHQTSVGFDGSVVNCCNAYERKNYLHPNFLEIEHDDLQQLKYKSELCKKCQTHGCDIICHLL